MARILIHIKVLRNLDCKRNVEYTSKVFDNTTFKGRGLSKLFVLELPRRKEMIIELFVHFYYFCKYF